ncbi:MAG: hypothetical protein ACSHX0_13360 [Akkermansiaceae bacterium]
MTVSTDEMTAILRQQIEIYKSRMLNKKEVAHHAGMTVSWLDNSQSPKAIKLRQIGVRYGISRTSAIRYPLQDVLEICLEDESCTKTRPLASLFPNDPPTTAS